MNLLCLVMLCCCVYTTQSYQQSYRYSRQQGKTPTCEKVLAPTCLNRVYGGGYNLTVFPNHMGQRTQTEALKELKHYRPLINIGCSKYLATFLCSLYVPLCAPDLNEMILPCRSLCLNSMRGCKPIMLRFGVRWRFNCDDYPDAESNKLCVGNVVDEDTKKVETKVARKNHKGKSRKAWRVGEENQVISLRCNKGKTIQIRKIRHKASGCCPTATKAVLSAMCNGKSTCNITVAAKTLGGHCKGNIGKVLIRYKCSHQVLPTTCNQRTV